MNKADSLPDLEDLSDLNVLLVEDDQIMRLSLEDRLSLEGIRARSAQCLAEARYQLDKGDIDLVVTDVRLPDGSGAELFQEIQGHHGGTPVILMTAFGDIGDAVALVKAGVVDYLTKPFDMTKFVATIRHNLSRMNDVRLNADYLGLHAGAFQPGSGVIGRSPAMRRIEKLVARLSGVNSSVLITGESGVGKEVVANLIHHNSQRAAGPMVKVNCAALPPSLIESELFGHEKGAFTGAAHRRIGRFEQAQKGTIFLDEIAENPPEIQVKLLRVLQERVLERVGGEDSIPLDVRVVAATQVDLEEAIKEGRFRPDLYWRLNVIHIKIPPLRERPEDILYLSRLFVNQHAMEMNHHSLALGAEAEAKLLTLPLYGNVRELKNIMERAVALCDGPRITAQDLVPLEGDDEDATAVMKSPTLRESVETTERQAIIQALVLSEWSIGRAADALNISRKNLWEKMKRYRIEKEAQGL